MSEVIRKKLIENIGNSGKSSHWQFHTSKAQFKNLKISNIDGYGKRKQNRPLLNKLHRRAQKKIFQEFNYANTDNYLLAREICKKQKRLLDIDVLRHVHTFNLLDSYNLFPKKVCVIGDGETNFVSLAIKKFEKIISINLPEILLNDLDLLDMSKIKYELAETNTDFDKYLNDKNISVILLMEKDKEILRMKNIDLYVNLASFQEMLSKDVQAYFHIIKTNKAYLYTCNRENKVLYGGEVSNFFDWPWKDHELLLDEICPWMTSFYTLKSPILFKKIRYEGAVRHRLVKFI